MINIMSFRCTQVDFQVNRIPTAAPRQKLSSTRSPPPGTLGIIQLKPEKDDRSSSCSTPLTFHNIKTASSNHPCGTVAEWIRSLACDVESTGSNLFYSGDYRVRTLSKSLTYNCSVPLIVLTRSHVHFRTFGDHQKQLY